jgi:hypothetical protein
VPFFDLLFNLMAPCQTRLPDLGALSEKLLTVREILLLFVRHC